MGGENLNQSCSVTTEEKSYQVDRCLSMKIQEAVEWAVILEYRFFLLKTSHGATFSIGTPKTFLECASIALGLGLLYSSLYAQHLEDYIEQTGYLMYI